MAAGDADVGKGPPESGFRFRSELCKAVVELNTSTRWRGLSVGDGAASSAPAASSPSPSPSPEPTAEPAAERFVAELFNYGSVLDRPAGSDPPPIPVLALKSKSALLAEARHSWVVGARERLQAVDSAIDFSFYADPTKDRIDGLTDELAELADGLRDFLRPQVFEPWKALSPELDAVKGSFEVRRCPSISFAARAKEALLAPVKPEQRCQEELSAFTCVLARAAGVQPRDRCQRRVAPG